MGNVRLRLHFLICACSLLFGAVSCSPAEGNDDKPTPELLRDTASPDSSTEQVAVRTENLVEIDSSQPPPDDLTGEIDSSQPPPDDLTGEIDSSQPPPDDLTGDDDKDEKNADCCVFKNSSEQVCKCETITGRPVGTAIECLWKGGTKRGSACGAYQDCNDAVFLHCPG